ncbi:MAG: RES domain-containing protein [Bacteroidetes bacterium]|nr:RES domain-containing protein [Bacteroidota bacterium]
MRNPDPSKVREFMRRIPDHLYRLDYDAIKVECNSYFPGIPISAVDFDNNKFFFNQYDYNGTNVVYRARVITNPDNRPFELVSQISYIPEDERLKIKEFGRVNKPGEPMFYGAVTLPTACTEAINKGNPDLNKNSVMLTVGVWKFETPLTFAHIPHSYKYFERFYKELDMVSESIQLEDIKRQDDDLRNKINNDFRYEILQFFADEFAKFTVTKDYEYKLSNYYADRVFNRIPGYEIDDQIDGIIYPSISLSYQHDNIVLKPEVVKTKLKFVHAKLVWFVNFSDTGGGASWNVIIDHIQADNSGKLLWDSNTQS